MKHLIRRNAILLTAFFQLLGLIACLAEAQQAVEVESGAVTFDSPTNLAGVEVKGRSSKLVARVDTSQQADSLVLQRIEATVAVKTLETGMKVRDEHMREYIFRTQDGREPDLQFVADNAACPALGSGRRVTCDLAGNLSIRGVARPFKIALHVKNESSASAFRVDGDAVVKLSDYGILAPSQFGVKCENDVKLHIEFTGKQKPAVTAAVRPIP